MMILSRFLTPCQCVTDYRYLVGLVSQIVSTFMDSSDILGKSLGLMLCTLDIPSDVNELESIASQWTPIFSLKTSRYLVYIFCNSKFYFFYLVTDHVILPVC